MRKDCPFFRIERAVGQRSNRVVMLAEFDRGSEMDTANGYTESLRKLNPYCSCLWVGVGVVYDQNLSFAL